MTRISLEAWRTDGLRRFGDNEMQWRFVCPSCGHVASVQDWKDAGAEESAVAFSCVGRWSGKNHASIFEKPGPCNYAGGGLIRLNPVQVECDGGVSINVFAFADQEVAG